MSSDKPTIRRQNTTEDGLFASSKWETQLFWGLGREDFFKNSVTDDGMAPEHGRVLHVSDTPTVFGKADSTCPVKIG
jgi:hypothetical protein